MNSLIHNSHESHSRVIYSRQPERHIGTGGREHHKFRIELNTLNGSRMISAQDAHFVAGVRIPHVHFTVRRAAENELGVRTEGRFDGDSLVVQMAGERLQGSAVESVDQPNHRPVRADQDGLSVPGEFESGPVALLLLVQLERDEGSLVEGAQVVEFDTLRVDTRREDQPLRVVRGDRTAGEMHQTLAVGRAQVPESQGLVHGPRQEGVLYRRQT